MYENCLAIGYQGSLFGHCYILFSLDDCLMHLDIRSAKKPYALLSNNFVFFLNCMWLPKCHFQLLENNYTLYLFMILCFHIQGTGTI